jgi:hypothetical protein
MGNYLAWVWCVKNVFGYRRNVTWGGNYTSNCECHGCEDRDVWSKLFRPNLEIITCITLLSLVDISAPFPLLLIASQSLILPVRGEFYWRAQIA